MAKHTPGPWQHTPGRDGQSFMSFTGPNGEPIVAGCGCCMSPYGCSSNSGHTYYNPCKTDYANARLIAAAPDLLAACELFIKFDGQNVYDDTTTYDELKAAVLAALKTAGAHDGK